MKNRLLSAALLTLVAAPAMAHVTANPDKGTAGAYFQTSLRITHGCDGSGTTAVHVKIPAGILSVRAQAKPGWQVTVTKRKLEHPAAAIHGKTMTEAVDEVVWTGGPLLDEQYDDFGLVMKLPDAAGQTLWFPTVQQCANGENRWVEIPANGAEWHSLAKPAPFVKLAPSGN